MHANPIPVFTQCLDCSHQCAGLKGALRKARTARSLYHGSLCSTLEKKKSHVAIVLTSGRENPTAGEVVTVQTSSSITESGLQLILFFKAFIEYLALNYHYFCCLGLHGGIYPNHPSQGKIGFLLVFMHRCRLFFLPIR